MCFLWSICQKLHFDNEWNDTLDTIEQIRTMTSQYSVLLYVHRYLVFAGFWPRWLMSTVTYNSVIIALLFEIPNLSTLC